MLTASDFQQRQSSGVSYSSSMGFISQGFGPSISTRGNISTRGGIATPSAQPRVSMPQLMLYNDTLRIRLIGANGAVIGRRQGPYVQFFENQKFISGLHAQLLYRPDTGWCIADKHSSNGTKLNDHQLQPDVEMSLKNGDIVTLANVVLKVSIN